MLPIVVLLGAVGLVVGSFLTVVVARLGRRESIVRGRSRCVHCRRELGWYELLPVVSFLAQGGQCRSCGGRIPRLYPLIELSTAILFAGLGGAILTGWLAPPPFLAVLLPARQPVLFPAVTFLFYALFGASAVAVSAYDLTRRLIPPLVILPLAGLGGGLRVAAALAGGDSGFILLSAAVGTGAFLLFWALWFFSSGRAMGRGDADVALAVSLWLEPPAAVVGFLLAFWFGATFGILGLAAGRLGWKSQMPFAPFLFAGALVALFLGPLALRLPPFGYGF